VLRLSANVTPEQWRQLSEMGWDMQEAAEEAPILEISDREPSYDVERAAARVVHALVDVLGLDPTQPVAGVVVTYE
jgi:hypothetical protein